MFVRQKIPLCPYLGLTVVAPKLIHFPDLMANFTEDVRHDTEAAHPFF